MVNAFASKIEKWDKVLKTIKEITNIQETKSLMVDGLGGLSDQDVVIAALFPGCGPRGAPLK